MPRRYGEPARKPAGVVATDSRPVIVAFGDSLSAGFGVDAGLSYPDYLQKEIDATGLAYRVVNLGISGDTTSGGLSRVSSALELKPKIVLLELGGNDGLRGTPLAETRQNIEQMTAQFLAAKAQVVIIGMTLPKNYGPEYIREFESIFADTARKNKLPRIPFLLEGVWNTPGLMQGDGIHPTAEGNARVAKLVMKTLRPLL
ncbi:MAG: arylesterase [Bryobacteraceae bacterium]|nr:arylesterase [Bryobacteraceae bacterium]